MIIVSYIKTHNLFVRLVLSSEIAISSDKNIHHFVTFCRSGLQIGVYF